MDYSMIALGMGGGIIFAGIIALLYRIRFFLQQDSETALSKLFLKEEALRGFKVLAASNAILTIPLAIESISIITGNHGIASTARYLMPLPMIGYLYFYIQIYNTTRPRQ